MNLPKAPEATHARPIHETNIMSNDIYVGSISNTHETPNVKAVFSVPHEGFPKPEHYRLNDEQLFQACQEKEPQLTREDFETYKHLETDIGALAITHEIYSQVAELLNSAGISFNLKIIAENKLHRGFTDVNRRPTTPQIVGELNTAFRELILNDPFHQEGPIRRPFDREKNPELVRDLEIKHLSSLSTIWDEIMKTRHSLSYLIEGHSMWPESPDAQTLTASKSMDEGILGIREYNRLVIEASKQNRGTRPDLCIITHERRNQDLHPFINNQLSEAVIHANRASGITALANTPYAGTNSLTSVAVAKVFNNRPNELDEQTRKCLILDYNKRLINDGPITNMKPKSREELAVIARPTASTIFYDILSELPKLHN